ncbi:BREX-1 system adenine-specific DNA-methyltransferase PglX [Parapusillimonas sp. JC17]|uniref:BREX-1 system adenine-specific DNA-methyltransferase PglX n=1 Tax=Parapusillimonas sp. JC17 TaxID=3445768 RepID=UPI003F9FCB15
MSENQHSSRDEGMEKYFFRASATDFEKIPMSPIAYWASDALFSNFEMKKLRDVADAKQGMATSDNGRFLRYWHEVSLVQLYFDCTNSIESESRQEKWYPYNKGGEFRRWFGNNEYVVNWRNNGKELKEFVEEISKLRPGGRLKNQEYYFLENITYSSLSSGLFSARYNSPGFLFDTKGSCIFPTSVNKDGLLSLLNSNAAQKFLNILCPTLDYSSIGLNAIPVNIPTVTYSTELLIELAKGDWDSYETSWAFVGLPLLNPDYHQPTLKASYQNLRTHWHGMVLKTQHLEEENNSIFIDAYGLSDELTPEVPLKEITLTCNPHYRYGGDKTDEELEALLLADTMREFISYAVGCMFGRYSLDKPGLILANQGETLADYLAQVPEPTFTPNKDNVIPMLDGDWFADDIAERFRRFLRVAFGEKHYEENLRFIEEALNIKGKRNYSLRDYLLSEFYTDHLKRYKKRPIYWLFSSPKGSFNALIYMHRYRPDTVSVVLNDYLREFRAKLLARKNHLEALGISASTSQSDKTKALKEIEKISKMIAEVDAYERDTLYPLATRQIEIDLDDGVKANYPKFGTALKKIPGLEAKDD